MRTDFYTKAVLTIIAVCLVWLCLDRSRLLPTVSAQATNQVFLAGWVADDGALRKFPSAGQPRELPGALPVTQR